jgi:hypothetical protein
VATGDGLRRLLRLLSVALVWLGAAAAATLTIAAFAVDRANRTPTDLATVAGVIAILVFAGVLALVMRMRTSNELRRYVAACVFATLLIFVTRPEGIIGGSVALVGGAIGVLRNL